VAVATTGIPVVFAFAGTADEGKLRVQYLQMKERRFATFGSVRLMAAAFPNKGTKVCEDFSGFWPYSVHPAYRTRKVSFEIRQVSNAKPA
jgi:hypothetical protein